MNPAMSLAPWESNSQFFWIPFPRRIASVEGVEGVRIIIDHWLAWPTFCAVLIWTALKVQFAYFQSQRIAQGCLGLAPGDKLHLSELGRVAGVLVSLWLAFGREVITINKQMFRLPYQIFGLGWPKRDTQEHVRNIRACFFLHAALYFDHAGRIRSFAKGVPTAEALRLIEVFRQFYPRMIMQCSKQVGSATMLPRRAREIAFHHQSDYCDVVVSAMEA